ncbi:short-chain dehydrogenase [Coleophoma cylindrospora]|uniref:Short-chain dehydrogenase n=1 Tax=Coleophoma cylindrospora TaxID=1849047 RepID=A0A3D8RZC9_9HELO|nr:short-chain dehydrogenase [Coleophoma cylindrospora]
MSFHGVALVTGAGSGIGRDCAIAFAVEGASAVAFADINLNTAQKAADEAKAKANNPNLRTLAIQVDVSNERSVELMVQKVQDEFGRIDYSVNSAGIGVQSPRPVTDTVMDEFQAFFDINVKGTMLCVRAVSQVMKFQEPRVIEGRNGARNVGRGTIVNLGSANSFVAAPAIVQYTSAKHAIMGITKTAALDLAPYSIRVNAVCPSWVETPMVDRAFSSQQEMFTALVKSLPAGRIATQEEVSDVILFLSGPKSTYVTGVGWIVDGGTTLQMNL